MTSGAPNWLGPANGVQFPTFVTYNGRTVNPVANVSTATTAITSFGTQNSFSNYYIVPVTAGTYLCGATVYVVANGTAWGSNDGCRFRIVDANADVVTGNTLYPEVDFRPYYMTVDGITNVQATVNNNMAGIFVTSSNVNLCWQAAISNAAGVPATHKLVIECPWWQKIA
jgi:hypothetical protein